MDELANLTRPNRAATESDTFTCSSERKKETLLVINSSEISARVFNYARITLKEVEQLTRAAIR
jgi:hypothetical protein